MSKPWCCWPDCDRDATVEVWTGPSFEDYSHSCPAHIGELSSDAACTPVITLLEDTPRPWTDEEVRRGDPFRRVA